METGLLDGFRGNEDDSSAPMEESKASVLDIFKRLEQEFGHRIELFGDASSYLEYRKDSRDRDVPPLPRLFVIVDEAHMIFSRGNE